ncbi:hypothetical protein [Clostridium estertheticum]|nr:hypothetical protein [Clostridium estertheticum]
MMGFVYKAKAKAVAGWVVEKYRVQGENSILRRNPTPIGVIA